MSLTLLLIIVIGLISPTLYRPILIPVRADESFQNDTVTELIVANELDVKESNTAPFPINISIVEGSIRGDEAYEPNPLHVKVGSKITWTNDDKTTHTATSGTITSNEYGKIFDSGYLSKGKSFTFVFDQPGEFEYFCLLHPTMIGKIVVSE
ncbi:MAG: cupredoxin domain-containing protein [Ignavibacteriales bacterium]